MHPDKRNDKASHCETGLARGETVKAPCPRRMAATLEQSARSGTVHPRYRMAKMPLMKRIIRVVP